MCLGEPTEGMRTGELIPSSASGGIEWPSLSSAGELPLVLCVCVWCTIVMSFNVVV